MVVFQDSSMVKYSILKNSTQALPTNQPFLDEIKKLEQKISFNGNFAKTYSNKRKRCEPNYELGCITHPEQFQAWCAFSNEEKTDPKSFYKFAVSCISDVQVLTPEYYISKLHHTANPEQSYESLVLAYSGYDGYFRIVDI